MAKAKSEVTKYPARRKNKPGPMDRMRARQWGVGPATQLYPKPDPVLPEPKLHIAVAAPAQKKQSDTPDKGSKGGSQ